MKEKFIILIALAVLALPVTDALGQSDAEKVAADEYARMVENAEMARVEAEKARQEAQRVAEQAREAARARQELERAELERQVVRTEERSRERQAREAEIERAREELSRAHRELREAQREVAQAHRELSRNEALNVTTRVINLGDRPVIGVVLGDETDEGVKLNGVSPDGPAETAGVLAGDILVSIDGADLSHGKGGARATVFATMETVEPGDTVELEVRRDGADMAFAVVAEVREPASWQSLVRIPEIATVRRIEGGPGERRIVVESTVVPEFDEEAMAERMEILRERLDDGKFHLYADDFPHLEKTYEFHAEDFSDMAGHAFHSADIWFGMPYTQGLELADINEGLGEYFKTDQGVLVLDAKEDNAYSLESGDVILSVGGSDIASRSDLVRALREVEPGEEIEIVIKRDRRNKTLKVTMPENRFGYYRK